MSQAFRAGAVDAMAKEAWLASGMIGLSRWAQRSGNEYLRNFALNTRRPMFKVLKLDKRVSQGIGKRLRGLGSRIVGRR